MRRNLRYDGELLHIAAHHGMNAKALKRLHTLYPMRPSAAGQISGRVIAQKKPVCIADIQESIAKLLADAASES